MMMMQGKVVVITGATGGIGLVTARELAALGATVVIVGRRPDKLEATAAELRQRGSGVIHTLRADLSSMRQVRALADAFRQQFGRLDVLVNNAGGAFSRRELTEDGYERTFALNHLSYFLLTNLLLDVLKASAPARIINVASDAHRGRWLDFDDLQNERDYGPSGLGAYGRSKLANILFTRELARRLEGSGVTANAVHPGAVATGIWGNTGGLVGRLIGMVAPLFMRTPEQGADTVIYLASSPEVEGISGQYFMDREPAAPSAAAQDDEAARRLWQISAQMVGLVETATA